MKIMAFKVMLFKNQKKKILSSSDKCEITRLFQRSVICKVLQRKDWEKVSRILIIR